MHRHPYRLAASVMLVVTVSEGCAKTAEPSDPHSFHVDTDGSPNGDGSARRPWDLPTALAQPPRVQPGDTLWLRGGTYSGTFASTLTGTSAAPIIVRQYPGEHATIQGTISVEGAYTWYWGFEVANANTGTQDVMGLNVSGPGTRLINLVVHDHSGNGIGVWSEAPDAEVYGTVLYNNGFCGSGAGCSSYGHGIYAQNETGTKLLADNIVFQSFGYGFHLYTEKSYLKNFTLDGNVSFNNGIRTGGNFLIGGNTAVENFAFAHNMSYQTPGFSNGGTWIGRQGPRNDNGTVENNYLVYGWPAFRILSWSRLAVRHNTVIGIGQPGSMIAQSGNYEGYSWEGNQYYGLASVPEWDWNGVAWPFSDWQTHTALGSSDSYTSASPTSTTIFVRPNKYEPGRANVIVYNWSGSSSVSADLSSVLSDGDDYEVRSVYALYGVPVARGTYHGDAITIPMPSVAPPVPLGGWPASAPGSTTGFQVFIVTRR